ncbi:hypothetical protein TorRG33x02_041450 [Trema orientale]|uniref:Uncharacterized protein n=1 Tax=Trema orientale TaxID=63057 RepID=A0A2P5FQD5_TREOI|nr:hypothetical protein TorRG33x02_041450 [Trema orientale]
MLCWGMIRFASLAVRYGPDTGLRSLRREFYDLDNRDSSGFGIFASWPRLNMKIWVEKDAQIFNPDLARQGCRVARHPVERSTCNTF